MNIVTSGQTVGINVLKDGAIKLVLHLQDMTPEQAGRLHALMNQFIKIYLTTANITTDKTDLIDAEKIEFESKSPSQVMRNVFYRLWEQDKEGYEDFSLYYRNKMEKVITHFKDKLI